MCLGFGHIMFVLWSGSSVGGTREISYGPVYYPLWASLQNSKCSSPHWIILRIAATLIDVKFSTDKRMYMHLIHGILIITISG